MEVRIRRVTGGDAETLRAVRLAALADAPEAFTSTVASSAALSARVWRERARASSTGDDITTYLAVTDDGPVGMVVGRRSPDEASVVELLGLWAAPTVRRHGVGRALIEAVATWAVAGGPTVVRLSVMPGNDAATRLYRRAGFVDDGVEHTPDGLVLHRMVRTVDPR